MALGGSYIDLLGGEDAEPDELAGRLVNGGNGISAGSPNEQVWLLLGPTGTLTYLDEDGKPLRGDLLTVLEGEAVRFAALGERTAQNNQKESAWLIGGDDGRVQLVNRDGEPETSITNQVFTDGRAILAGAYSAASQQWLVGSDEGTLSALDGSLNAVTNETSTFGGTPIAAIAGNPDPAAEASKRWIVAAGDQLAYAPGGAPISFPGKAFTALAVVNDQLIAGTASGEVAQWDFESVSASGVFADALGGEAVRAIFSNGTETLVLGEGGKARRLDASGAPQGEVVTLGDGSALVSARWANGRWLIATQSSLIVEASGELEPLVSYREPLDGEELYDSAPGRDRVIVVGGGGKFAVVSPQGDRLGEVKQVAGSTLLHAASWSGSTFLVGGAGGIAQLLDEQGEASGEPIELLGGERIGAIAWSGNFWLVAGDNGAVQRVRPNGEVLDTAIALPGFVQIHDATWSGTEWYVVGHDGTQGLGQRVASDAKPLGQAVTFPTIASLNAVGWSGLEWLVGGSDGLVQVVSSAGEPRTMPGPQPRDVLTGSEVYSIAFYDNTYVVAGANGLTRRITQDLATSVAPVAVTGLQTVREIVWTRARGYGQGACLTNELCFVGECIGASLQSGFCCDRACDRACESCLASENGAADGLCSPVPAGEMPVVAEGCPAQDAASCGQTGMCDGQGECALQAPDVICAPTSCSQGAVSAETTCDGAGTCQSATPTSCAPYVGCDGDACPTSCEDDEECVEGLACVEMTCQDPPLPEPMPEPTPPEEGCCAVVAPKETSAPWWSPLALLALWGWRRRRRA